MLPDGVIKSMGLHPFSVRCTNRLRGIFRKQLLSQGRAWARDMALVTTERQGEATVN